MKKLILLSFLAILSACKNADVNYKYPENPENIRKERAGKFFDNISLFDGKNTDQKASNKTVSKVDSKNSSPIWLASIEIISSLLPISTIDETSGLIVTEWYQDGQNQSDRIKINLLVKGKEAKKENLLLTIFRQTKDAKGVWIDEQSNNQSISVQMIKDKIIAKAQSK